MDRREFLSLLVPLAASGFFAPFVLRRTSFAVNGTSETWDLRRVLPGDEEQLLALMQSCVSAADSFHGACNPIEWTKTWAETVISDRPGSLVITLNGVIVAYQDLPNKKPRTFGVEAVDRYQKSFWCGAAGVRLDILGKDDAVSVFRQLLYAGFNAAIDLGYEFVRAAAPWEQHPYMAEPFATYPGLTSEAFLDTNGTTKFLLVWQLDDAVAALEKEGARNDLV